MTMNIDVMGVLFIPALTLALAGICYGYARAIRRGEPLTKVQTRMILYACLFCFGMGYAMVFKDQLGAALQWPSAWAAFTVLWGLILATFAWYRHQRKLQGGQ